MNWSTRGKTHVSKPYSVISGTNGEYEVWMQTDGKYGCLARGLTTLLKAKAYCEMHKAKQAAVV